MTVASLRGARFVAAGGPAERVAEAVSHARAGGVVYVYWGEIDKSGHAYGLASWRWLNEVERLDRAMASLRAELPADAALWLTADHGMVDCRAARTIDIAADPVLARGVRLVAGEARAVHLYGEDADEIAERWSERLDSKAWVLARDQAIKLGLFGPVVTDRVRPMLGDVIVAAAGSWAIVDSRTASPASLAMVGQHGSLTAAEMEVPLIDIAAGT
jgi:hypothetical protein